MQDETRQTKTENDRRRARHRRLLVLLVILAIALTAAITLVSVRLYTVRTRESCTEVATGAAKMAAALIDGDRVNGWLENGRDENYYRTRDQLQNILVNSPDLEYLYVYQILEDGCHVIFDFDSEDVEASEFAEVIDFDESFVPMLPILLAGGRIAPIESNDSYGWLLTVYEPVEDHEGRCVAYVGADISMLGIREYVRSYMGYIVLIGAAFLALCVLIGSRISIEFHRADELDVLRDQQKRDKQLLREIVESFAKVIDMKDAYTQGHSTRVAQYTAKLAEELGYDAATVERYYDIALMHDIGKIGIPDDVLNKPGRLTEDEYHTIQSHTVRGYGALKNISLMPEIATGAEYHHERPDGKGYPQGLKGEEIPRAAQIIALADAFDAMYSKRPYRDRMNFDKVVAIIRDASGTQLTPDVVDAFLRLVDRGEFRAPDDDGGGSTTEISNLDKTQNEP